MSLEVSNEFYGLQNYNIAQRRIHSAPTARAYHDISITVNRSGGAEKRPSTLFLSDLITASCNVRLKAQL